jgi:hypothetical protein
LGKLDDVRLKELGVVVSIIGTIGSVWYTAGQIQERLDGITERIERLERHEDSRFDHVSQIQSTQAPGGSSEPDPFQQRQEVAFVLPEVRPYRPGGGPEPLPGSPGAD